MNALPLLNQTVSSLEVAKMMELEHSELLKRIRRYINQFNEGNISPVDFWNEDVYTDTKGEKRPCYQITKKGCEFIAHKTTGTKGTIFTARYINRFWEMEEALNRDEPQFLPMPDSEPQFLPIPEYDKPLFPTLREKNWCLDHSKDIQFIMYKMKISKKQLFHMILTRLGFKYDIPDCRRIYKKTFGEMPRYYMDIVDFFPEMYTDATEYLEQMKNDVFF